MRLYLDTSVLGALADSDEPQRVEITRRFLGSLAEGTHIEVISNAVQEELALAPGNVRELVASILSAVNSVNLRLGDALIEIISPMEV